jgi:hypothetical protein
VPGAPSTGVMTGNLTNTVLSLLAPGDPTIVIPLEPHARSAAGKG